MLACNGQSHHRTKTVLCRGNPAIHCGARKGAVIHGHAETAIAVARRVANLLHGAVEILIPYDRALSLKPPGVFIIDNPQLTHIVASIHPGNDVARLAAETDDVPLH